MEEIMLNREVNPKEIIPEEEKDVYKRQASAAELRLWMRISVSAVESVRRSVSLMRSI